MAIWQFVLKIFPDKLLLEQFGCIPSLLDLEKVESINSWGDYLLPEEIIRNLEKILPSEISWSADIKQFGKLEESCVELSFENGSLFSFLVRLDVRKNPNSLINFLLVSLPKGQLTMYSLDGARVSNRKSLLKKIEESSASKFVEDPESFLSGLKKKD
jgi:hypothetical protein